VTFYFLPTDLRWRCSSSGWDVGLCPADFPDLRLSRDHFVGKLSDDWNAVPGKDGQNRRAGKRKTSWNVALCVCVLFLNAISCNGTVNWRCTCTVQFDPDDDLQTVKLKLREHRVMGSALLMLNRFYNDQWTDDTIATIIDKITCKYLKVGGLGDRIPSYFAHLPPQERLEPVSG